MGKQIWVEVYLGSAGMYLFCAILQKKIQAKTNQWVVRACIYFCQNLIKKIQAIVWFGYFL